MKLSISARDNFEINLLQKDIVSSVIQNVLIILNTWMNSLSMYRDFGISSEPMHKPMNTAEPLLMVNIQEAVEKYEPRVSVIGITFINDSDSPGRINPIVEVSIKNE